VQACNALTLNVSKQVEKRAQLNVHNGLKNKETTNADEADLERVRFPQPKYSYPNTMHAPTHGKSMSLHVHTPQLQLKIHVLLHLELQLELLPKNTAPFF